MTPAQKVSFMIQRLTGRAAEVWRQGGATVADYTAFLVEFTVVFGHPDHAQSSSRKLQGQDSVADYTIRFHILAASSGWNQSALLEHFCYGFNTELQKEI